MSKPGLGKGLGDLLNGDQVAGKGNLSKPKPEDGSPGFGRGLNTLVKAKGEENDAPKKKEVLPVWFFFAADLLLLAFTVAVTFDRAGSFDLRTVVFCGITVALGGLLALIGVMRAVG